MHASHFHFRHAKGVLVLSPFDKAQAVASWEQYRIGMHATPRAWAHKAENLMHAFEVLIAASDPNSMHLNLIDQALMLAGMSVEVQLKALITHDRMARSAVTPAAEPSAGPDRQLWKVFRTHDLVLLADKAKLALEDSQKRIAIALTEYIYWRGRYVVPTAKRIDDFLPVEGVNGLFGPKHHIPIDEIRSFLWYVVDAVKNRLYAQA